MAEFSRRWTMLILPLSVIVMMSAWPGGAAPGGFTTSHNNVSSGASSEAEPSPAASPSPSPTVSTQTQNVTGYHDLLFGPYDPNRHYEHVRYFEVGKMDFEHVQAPVVIGCWILIAGLAKMAFHSLPSLSHMVPESCLLIALGIIVGAFLYVCLGDIEASHHLDPDTFFLYMLPPIILDAGYFMPNRLFFDNFGTIMLLAVIGTIFNTFAIAGGLYLVGMTGVYGVETNPLDIFLFAALISAVDPVAVLAVFEEIQVNDVLYIVVFGESLMNDAVTVGLYHMFEEYILVDEGAFHMSDIGKGFVKFLSAALGGTFIGIVWGFITAFLTRFTHRASVMEPIFIFTMSFLAYLNAEIFHLSGILAITFCGLTMKNYVITNVTNKSHTTIKCMMKMLASCSESAIFMLLGVATVHNHHDWNFPFVLATLLFCLIFRSIAVVVLTAFANRLRLHQIAAVDVFVIAYGGLRGAIAFALVMMIDPHYVKEQQMFLTTTISIVYFTVFVQGMTIKPLVQHLGVKRADKRKITMNERIHLRTLDHTVAGVEDIVGHPYSYNIRHRFKQFNDRFLLPCLTRQHHSRVRDPKIMETFTKLAMVEAMQTFIGITNIGVPRDQAIGTRVRTISDLVHEDTPDQGSTPAVSPPPLPRRFSRRRISAHAEDDTNSRDDPRFQTALAQDLDAREILRGSAEVSRGEARRSTIAVLRERARLQALGVGRRRLDSEPQNYSRARLAECGSDDAIYPQPAPELAWLFATRRDAEGNVIERDSTDL